MQLVPFLVVGFIVSLAQSDDDCSSQMKSVFSCLKKKNEDNKDADNKKIEDGKTAVTKCFTDNGCKGPDYDKKPGSSDPAAKLKFENDNTPAAVKDCLKKLFQKVASDKVNQCLKEKNVKPIADSEVDGLDLKGEGGTRPEGDERLAKAAFGVARALKECEKTKDAKTREAVVKCIQPIKEAAEKEVCKRISDCKKDSKVSEACSKRNKEIKDAICQCKQDQFKIARGKVEELQKQTGDVEIEQLQQSLPDDVKNFDFDGVTKCYTDNGAALPPTLVAFQLLKNGGPLGVKPTVSQSQLQGIHDYLDDEIKNPHCGCP